MSCNRGKTAVSSSSRHHRAALSLAGTRSIGVVAASISDRGSSE